jgi:hypothetical protein
MAARDMPENTCLRLLLVVFSAKGLSGDWGGLELVIGLQGLRLIQEEWRALRGTVVEPGRNSNRMRPAMPHSEENISTVVAVPDIRDFEIGETDFIRLVRCLNETGLPERDPDIAASVDTSNVSQDLLLDVMSGLIAPKRRTFHFGWWASGFEGKDAPAVRRFLRELLSLAGCDLERFRDLTGG